MNRTRTSAETAAYEHLERAMEHPTSLALQVRSRVHLYRGRYDDSLADATEAVRGDHNDADALTTLAEALIFTGEPEAALEPITKAQRLDPYNLSYHSFLRALAAFGQGKFKDAVLLLEKALELGPDEWSLESGWRLYSPLYTLLVASYAYLERHEDAERVLAEIKTKWSNANVATEMYYWLYKKQEDRDRLEEGLLLAGMRER